MDEEDFKGGLRLILVVAVGVLAVIMLFYAAKEAGCAAFFQHGG